MASEPSVKPARVFCSYAHKDEALRNQLDQHLGGLRRSNLIAAWHDRKIVAGTDWRSEIKREIDAADIFLLLVSPSFIDSEFCYSVELKRALERHRKGEALIIPIAIRPCDWEGTLLAGLQALPKDRRAVTTWTNRDRAFLDIAQGIRRAIDSLDEWRATASPKTGGAAKPTLSSEMGLVKVLTQVFGEERRASLAWLKEGIRCASAVAKIEDVSGEPRGTGFLVERADLGLQKPGPPLLLTTSHAVDEWSGVGPRYAFFEQLQERRLLDSVLWTSENLHATLFSLNEDLDTVACRIAEDNAFQASDETQIFVIGHPLGGPISFSLWHNRWLDYREPQLKYRAATDPGSGGSPVFDGQWRVLAMHYARSYDACQGMSMLAIKKAVLESIGPTN